ncbi:MAG TPA: WYL domain-containing protein [Solirubrobacteraceae bacterium]|jgi:proteasome accessory factor C|nr:WYL domain-containing protein [Solirubrobacteraceae bacterium]
MAKDTEKLIRQLSLISYLMAERRPVTAPEIRRDVEGYSVMNEDAFARRFYADRSELEALGIVLSVEKPQDGQVEQEQYSLPPENFHLPPIEFDDAELAALWTALQLLDGKFAYAEPLRLALQQISWGRPSPLDSPVQQTIALGITGAADGHEISQRLAKIETAIFRRKTIVFEYYTMERDSLEQRKVDPYQLLFQGGQFYVVGCSHERDAIRVFRLSRIQGKVGYATKAEHDFQRPSDFDPRGYADRIQWQFGDPIGNAEIWISSKIAWQIQRHFGRYGELRPADDGSGSIFTTSYSNARQLIAWVLGLSDNAQIVGPSELAAELRERVHMLAARHSGDADELPVAADHEPRSAPEESSAPAGAEDDTSATEPESLGADAVIRPERFARLVTLASILIDSGRSGRTLHADDLRERLKLSEQELQEDIAVLNVVNFGAGTYVLYAEILADGTVEVDPEPYGDAFARPARLLPVEAKALIAAIDLIGEHIPEGSLASVRRKVVAALGEDPAHEGLQIAALGGDDAEIAAKAREAISTRQLLSFEYFKENEGVFSTRVVEPYQLVNGLEGWYIASYDPEREAVRHFRLDRIKSAQVSDTRFEPRPELDFATGVDGWLRTGEVPASNRARVWISPDRARWVREDRTVISEGSDGSVVVDFGYAGLDWLVRNVLKEAGDAVVLEPTEARDAVRAAAAEIEAVVPV